MKTRTFLLTLALLLCAACALAETEAPELTRCLILYF